MVDECCPAAVVGALRAAGHDVVSMAETAPSTTDAQVLELARHDDRILITEDKDFGEHVMRRGTLVAGVILLRLPAMRGTDVARRAMHVIGELGEQLAGKYVVVLRDRIRLRSLSEAD